MELVRDVYMTDAVVALRRLPTSARLFDTLPMFQDPFYRQIKEFLKSGHVRPGFAVYNLISSELQVAIGEVLAGIREPEAALDVAITRVDRGAARYGVTSTTQ